ncbi:MAG TPA: hypothetical protein VN461_11435 [Vicinamibacteria bacterium]|jgi:hypothetical protein|nr:hypothetical protein [Vicinamibacteria bacterium]
MTEVWGQILLKALLLFTVRHEEFLPAAPLQLGTAIVAIRTEDLLVVAADSKTTRLDAPDVSTNTCKIQEAAGVFFAVAGLRRSTDGDFDVPSLAARACRASGNLDDKVASFEEAMQGPLKAALVQIRDTAPDYYRGRERRHAAFVEVAFFANEAGKPRFLVRDFKARESEQKGLSIEVGGAELPSPGYALMGEAREMRNFLEANPIVDRMNPIEGARAVLDRAATAHPETVGLPIDIVQLDGRAVRWVDRKSECSHEP